MGRARCCVVISLALLALAATPRDDDYFAILRGYQSGDADAAIAAVGMLAPSTIDAGVRRIAASRDATLAAAAVGLHTEVVARSLGERNWPWHLRIAESLLPIAAHVRGDGFRRAWLLAAIVYFEDWAQPLEAHRLAHDALSLFHHDADLLTLDGIAEELMATPRFFSATAAESRLHLGDADSALREAVSEDADNREARLRLGHVEYRRGASADARLTLRPLLAAADPRLRYLAAITSASVEDGAGSPEAAAQLYDLALAAVPGAQTAALGRSELHHRAGGLPEAASLAQSGIGSTRAADPWWGYYLGETWRLTPLLDELRRQARK